MTLPYGNLYKSILTIQHALEYGVFNAPRFLKCSNDEYCISKCCIQSKRMIYFEFNLYFWCFGQHRSSCYTFIKGFVPHHLCSKPLQILLWNLQYLLIIITYINRQRYINMWRFLSELWPFFDLENTLNLGKIQLLT